MITDAAIPGLNFLLIFMVVLVFEFMLLHETVSATPQDDAIIIIVITTLNITFIVPPSGLADRKDLIYPHLTTYPMGVYCQIK